MKKLNKSIVVRDLKLKLLLCILKIYTHIFIVDLRCIKITDSHNCKDGNGKQLKEFCGWEYCGTHKHSCPDKFG